MDITYVLRDTTLIVQESRWPVWFSIKGGIEYNNTVYYNNNQKLLVPIEIIFDEMLIKKLKLSGIVFTHSALGLRIGYQIVPKSGLDRFAIFFNGNP